MWLAPAAHKPYIGYLSYMSEGEQQIQREVSVSERTPNAWTEAALFEEFLEAGEVNEQEALDAAGRIMREYVNADKTPSWGEARALASYRQQLRAYETIRAHESELQ